MHYTICQLKRGVTSNNPEQTLRSHLTLSRAYGSCLAFQHFISVIVGVSFWLAEKINELDFHWLWMHFRECSQSQLIRGRSAIGYFRLPPGLCMKTRLSAQPFIGKWFFILMQIKLIFTRKVVHLASFRKWGFLELESGLFHRFCRQAFFSFYPHPSSLPAPSPLIFQLLLWWRPRSMYL